MLLWQSVKRWLTRHRVVVGSHGEHLSQLKMPSQPTPRCNVRTVV
jgi:hypothetical protein